MNSIFSHLIIYNIFIMTNKWTAEEEIKLVNDISKGKTFSELKDQYNRTELALELRLKKIIYENINAGKTATSLAKSLKLQEDKINQMFYAYKDYLDKQGKPTTNITIPETKIINKSKVTDVVNEVIDKITEHKININPTTHNNEKNNKDKDKDDIIKKIEKIANKLEAENKLLKAIVDNKLLKDEINKLNKRGEIDKKTKKILKKLIT